MAQHYLLSAASRKMSLSRIGGMTEEQAWQEMVMFRWGGMDQQVCPACGTIRKHHFIRSRHQWRCKDCGHSFSVTSGTVFAHHKLSCQDTLSAVATFVQAVKGKSALELSRNLDVQYKTAYVLFHKLRDVLWRSRDVGLLSGEVEMDGGYFHSYVRPHNKRRNRVDRRLRANLNPFKRSVLVMRERGEKGQGARRTIVQVIKNENDQDIPALTRKYVKAGATVYSDEHPSYIALAARHPVKQVNHQEEYSADDGTNQNQAESFFSRMRRLVTGQIHKCDRRYLLYYANEIAWREDMRRKSSEELYGMLMKLCLSTRPSREWSKYWQGNHIKGDTMFIAG